MNWVTIAKQRNIIQDGSKYLNDMSVAALMGANRATPLTPPRRTPRYQPRHALHPPVHAFLRLRREAHVHGVRHPHGVVVQVGI